MRMTECATKALFCLGLALSKRGFGHRLPTGLDGIVARARNRLARVFVLHID